MSYRVTVVCDLPVGFGFRLAGLKPHAAGGGAAAARLLEELTEDGRWGVILVQEDLAPDIASTSADHPLSGPLP